MTDIAELIKEARILATWQSIDLWLSRADQQDLLRELADALEALDRENQALATTLEARIEPVGLYTEDMLTWDGTLFRREVSPWVKVPDDRF